MLKSTTKKLYKFIATLMQLIEQELEELGKDSNLKNSRLIRKNIIENLNKLVNLVVQLNKLNQNESTENNAIMPDKDQEIINNFLAKYKDSNNA